MATIGQPLRNPEVGWRRIEETDSLLNYLGTFNSEPSSSHSGGSMLYTTKVGDSIRFAFKGTKLRVISDRYTTRNANIQISIDGVTSTFSEYAATGEYCIFVYEKLGLPLANHTVEIINSGSGYMSFDAIDIDEDGQLVAQIGLPLINPEAGWNRFDNKDARISYVPAFTSLAAASCWAGEICYTNTAGATIKFKFKGTKLRLLTQMYNNRSMSNTITIDGVTESYSEYVTSTPAAVPMLVYEKLDLPDTVHEVTIVNGGSGYVSLDAVDIVGGLTHPTLTEKFDIQDMEIGDVISCEYVATSGAVGMFSKIGSTKNTLLSKNPTTTPNGSFYFIKVDKGLLIADRGIQKTIGWLTLNKENLIEKRLFSLVSTVVPNMSGATSPSGEVKSGAVYSAQWYGYNAFNSNNTTGWASAGGKENWWLQYMFAEPTIIKNYTIKTSNILQNNMHMPKSWKMMGSNNGTIWTELHSVIGESDWLEGQQRTYLISSPNNYKYYKIQILNTKSDTDAVIGRLLLNVEGVISIQSSIRVLKGGQAWGDNNNDFATIDQGKGAYPNNEWDKYILNSDLNGNITPGDINIWNITPSSGNISIESPIGSVTYSNGINGNGLSLRLVRGSILSSNPKEMTYWAATADPTAHFRPVLEYIDESLEIEKRPKTLWY